MQAPSDKLFRLIKSLSKSEKGYFLKASGKSSGENSQYIKLFNVVDSLKIYDERKIKTILKDEPCIRQLHVAKNYLYKILMRSLYLFNSESSSNYKCAEAVGNISLLYAKGLYNDCAKEIRKAKAFAHKKGKYENLLEILRWESILMFRELTASIPNNIIEEESKAAEIIQNQVGYRRLYHEIFSLMREKGSIRNKDEKKLYIEIMSDPLLKSVDNALCFESKILYYKIYTIYSSAESDDKKCFTYAEKLVKFMTQHNEFLNDFTNEYVFAMVQKLTSSFNMGEYKKALAISKELRGKKIKYIEQKEYIFYSTYVIELFVYIVDCEFEKGLKIIPQIENELKILSDEINAARLTLYRYIFYIYFGLEDYSTSLIWLNKILNANLHKRQDLYSLTHILNLIVHYELNNVDLIHNAVINTYRNLYKRKKIYKFESEILKFIRKISNIADASQLREEFRILRLEILKLVDDPYERIPLQYFDFISWLDSKISGKSFIEMKTLKKDS
ncbi:MAG: hypothetical protein ABI840_03070 [bacterium]